MVEGAVDIIHRVVFVLAIVWVLSQLVVTRRKLRTEQVVILPLFAATLVFFVCILMVAALGASPLHLLWLFLLSFVLGLALLLFPPGVKLTLACLGLLAGLPSLDEPQPASRRRIASTARRHRRHRR
jgi:cell division protein FtsW (lipid II flippase)